MQGQIKEGALLTTSGIEARGFRMRDARHSIKAPKGSLSVVMYLGNVTPESIQHFRPDGMMAALGYHKMPPAVETMLQDALRWRFVSACLAGDERARHSADLAEQELGQMPADLQGKAAVTWTNNCTDRAIALLASFPEDWQPDPTDEDPLAN